VGIVVAEVGGALQAKRATAPPVTHSP
jgi:hypothetical protein